MILDKAVSPFGADFVAIPNQDLKIPQSAWHASCSGFKKVGTCEIVSHNEWFWLSDTNIPAKTAGLVNEPVSPIKLEPGFLEAKQWKKKKPYNDSVVSRKLKLHQNRPRNTPCQDNPIPQPPFTVTSK